MRQTACQSVRDPRSESGPNEEVVWSFFSKKKKETNFGMSSKMVEVVLF